jgi:hypothetical protein
MISVGFQCVGLVVGGPVLKPAGPPIGPPGPPNDKARGNTPLARKSNDAHFPR